MVKPLSFKGDKKSGRKRKRLDQETSLVPSKPTDPSNEPDQTADDTWVSAEQIEDISGPIVMVFPTAEDPSSIACDSTGKVFPITIENMLDANPYTSEPHDVRQVWIANRIVGSDSSFTFKGHHGKLLACDKLGMLAATREAAGVEETFTCCIAEAGTGMFALQSQYEKFLGLDLGRSAGSQVRGDYDTVEFASKVCIRMQARFKPKLRAAKAEKAREKISRSELERLAGRKLGDEDVTTLKKARREGDFYEKLLDVKVKGKHDKFG